MCVQRITMIMRRIALYESLPDCLQNALFHFFICICVCMYIRLRSVYVFIAYVDTCHSERIRYRHDRSLYMYYYVFRKSGIPAQSIFLYFIHRTTHTSNNTIFLCHYVTPVNIYKTCIFRMSYFMYVCVCKF